MKAALLTLALIAAVLASIAMGINHGGPCRNSITHERCGLSGRMSGD